MNIGGNLFANGHRFKFKVSKNIDDVLSPRENEFFLIRTSCPTTLSRNSHFSFFSFQTVRVDRRLKFFGIY